MNKLEQLRRITKVVADTGDIDTIKQYAPIDATTNPSLLFKAAQQPQYQHLVKSAIAYGAKGSDKAKRMAMILDKVAVNFGCEILKLIPGRISTEVDSRLSFDAAATIESADHIIKLYDAAGVSRERVLIKIASTWEGIKAAEHLERKGVHCNLTLMFSIAQAIAAAEAGITLISPFVGRIFDWYKKHDGVSGYTPAQDPGVKSVTAIYNYFKAYNYNTVVMGASFRNTDEILELAGCDLLTISPDLMASLQTSEGNVPRKLDPTAAKQMKIEPIDVSETHFRWLMNQDPMATEKLAEGIRGFTVDTLKLETLINKDLAQVA